MGLSCHPDYTPRHSCGCGSDNARFDIIPDRVFGVSIKKSCCIHDHRYQIGGTQADKDSADREFLMNMFIEIEEGIKWYMPTFLARRRALDYYEAVVRLGDKSFNWRIN